MRRSVLVGILSLFALSPVRGDEAADKAVKDLSTKYSKADVARYFWALLWQDPETWGGLKGRPELALE